MTNKLYEKSTIEEVVGEEPKTFVGTVYILRGLPGSGKSSIADILAFYNEGLSGAICCADDYHMTDGKYMWSPDKVGYAHKMCRKSFLEAIQDGKDNIVVANTNTMASEMEFYREEAKKANYFIQIVTIGEFSDEAVELYHKQNTHNVPLESIKRMRDRFKLV